MANRYWVGGAGTWNTSSTANWSASSGGASGASAPTATDDVFFDQAGTYTVTVTAGRCQNITVSAGTVTFSGVTTGPTISGSMSLVAGTVWSIGAALTTTFNATTTGQTVTTNGVSLSSQVTFNGVGGGWTLGSALTLTQTLTVTNGSFNSGNFAITTSGFSSSNSNTRSISLGSSTVTISITSSTALNLGTTTGLTWNAGTSQINLSSGTSGIASGNLTFNNVSFTSNAAAILTITGVNTFSTLAFAGRTTLGMALVNFSDNQTISTLTLSAGTNAAYRTTLRSDIIGTQRTLAVTTLTAGAADYDFRDIAVTGSASPIAPTRAGDAKGNSGITFPAAKTVYYRNTGSANWGTAVNGSWSLTSGGAANNTAFPLPQDTAVFPAATYPASGSTTTLNSNYNIGTIDMSLRTTNTMVLATGTTAFPVYGNWINGTGTTRTGTGVITFAGRTAQTITSASGTFTQSFLVNSPGGSVTIQDDFAVTTAAATFTLTAGTLDANGFGFVLSGATSSFSSTGTATRTIAVGSNTWNLSGSGASWTVSGSGITVTGTGTLNFSSGSAKTFAGGDVQTYPILSQGGAGTLTVSENNKFADLVTNDVGAVRFTSGTTNEFTAFNLTGTISNTVTLGASTTAQATLKKPSTWYMGANSIDAGNNTNLVFTAGGGIDYLSVSYINGTTTAPVTHATTGALNGPGSAIVGAAVRFRAFATSGSLNGPGSAIVGAADHSAGAVSHTTTGALNGQGTIVNGSAARFRAFATSGALNGQGAAIVGSATRFRAHTTTGVLNGPGSAIAGSAARFRSFNATGSLFGQGAALSGVASRVHYFTASGALLGPGAAINGNASVLVGHVTTGALVGPGSAIAGVSNHISLYPDPADVREGVQYGPGGIYVGTLTVGTGRSIIRLRSFTEEGS
jgi:hypothetical protein